MLDLSWMGFGKTKYYNKTNLQKAEKAEFHVHMMENGGGDLVDTIDLLLDQESWSPG